MVRDPVLAFDGLGALAGAGPGLDWLAEVERADGGDGPDVVDLPLDAPAGDAGVEEGVGQGEEQLDVFVDAAGAGPVRVAAGDVLGEHAPVAGGQLLVGSAGHQPH